MFGPGGELYCPELLSPPLFQEAGLSFLPPEPAGGLLSEEEGVGRPVVLPVSGKR